jgi:hypothetical protein
VIPTGVGTETERRLMPEHASAQRSAAPGTDCKGMAHEDIGHREETGVSTS